MSFRLPRVLLLFAALLPIHGCTDEIDVAQAPPTPGCDPCVEWNEPQEPLRIFGNTYWVGTRGLGAILITSDEGHVLIDGGLAESARPIAESIRALGFALSDVKLILNSHAHFDHAGGISALQRATGARVAATPWSAEVLEAGESGPGDPQYGVLFAMEPVAGVERIADGDTLRVGPLALVAHSTPGHTPGGTTWTWQSCEDSRCLEMVYADSQTPVSADDFLYTANESYPSAIDDFRRSHAVLASLTCDVILTPHPGASGFWDRLDAGRDAPQGLVDGEGCRRYADAASQALDRRIAAETGAAGAE